MCGPEVRVPDRGPPVRTSLQFNRRRPPDRDEFGLNQSKVIVIDSNNPERDTQISLRNLREFDGAGKAAQRPTFPQPDRGPVGDAQRDLAVQLSKGSTAPGGTASSKATIVIEIKP